MSNISWDPEVLKKRRKRAKVMALLLGAFALLLVFVTMARLGGNVANRAPSQGQGQEQR